MSECAGISQVIGRHCLPGKGIGKALMSKVAQVSKTLIHNLAWQLGHGNILNALNVGPSLSSYKIMNNTQHVLQRVFPSVMSAVLMSVFLLLYCSWAWLPAVPSSTSPSWTGTKHLWTFTSARAASTSRPTWATTVCAARERRWSTWPNPNPTLGSRWQDLWEHEVT